MDSYKLYNNKSYQNPDSTSNPNMLINTLNDEVHDVIHAMTSESTDSNGVNMNALLGHRDNRMGKSLDNK